MTKLLCAVLLVGCARTPEKKAPPPDNVAPKDTTSAAAPDPAKDPTKDPTKDKLTLADVTAGLPKDGALMAEVITDLGSIRCKLFPDEAPETVISFVGLARGLKAWQDPQSSEWVKQPFYDGLLFHRVIPGFMIQGGDPVSKNPLAQHLGMSGPGFTLPDEVSPKLHFDKGGMLAMANKGPGSHSAGSQFFITEVPVTRLDGGYAIFGECDGVDVVSAITRVARDGNDRPDKPVAMKIKIYRQ